MQIDLNADLGEGCGNDEALLRLVSSANIACGWHAGDAALMHRCVRWALDNGVAIGAHPSFPDRENFGRSEMRLPPSEVFADRGYQPDGSLVPRSRPGALIEEEEEALAQALSLVREHRVRAVDGRLVPVNAQTLCLHGDGAHALEFARRIRERLTAEGIAITASA